MDKNVPPDLSQCVFVIEQALSVRALQEIISSNDAEAVSEFGCVNRKIVDSELVMIESMQKANIVENSI